VTPRVTVVGLGPAGPDLVTNSTSAAITRVGVRFLRTTRHAAASVVEPAESFDEVYEGATSLEEVYRTIVDRLVRAADEHGEVLYAVPGSPAVAERTVALLRDEAKAGRIEVDVLPALSFCSGSVLPMNRSSASSAASSIGPSTLTTSRRCGSTRSRPPWHRRSPVSTSWSMSCASSVRGTASRPTRH
jgi:hypothetical protein